ncbi:hypothetical protein K9M42_03010 [Patescibacteria group bacterium]|nr:hypothetical protein [Patescibacteria group bacterium]
MENTMVEEKNDNKKVVNKVNFQIKTKSFLKGIEPAYLISLSSNDNEFEDKEKLTLNVLKDKMIVESNGKYLVSNSPIIDKYIDELNYECKAEGTATVNSKELMDVLQAFPPSEDINVSSGNGELIINLVSNPEREQSVSLITDGVRMPMEAPEFAKTVRINREVFVNGVNKVKFAMGIAKTNRKYMCTIVQTKKDSIRFMAGTGGEFAISDVEGKAITEQYKSEEVFIIPKESVDVVQKILEKASCDSILLKEAVENVNKAENPAQIVIEYDGQSIVLVGLNTAGKPQNVDKFLNSKYENTVMTNANDWQYIVKGIEASDNHELKSSHDVHNTEVKNDIDNEQLLIQTLTKKKCKANIPIDGKSKMKEDSYFHCNSTYIRDMIKSCDSKKNIITMKYDGYKEEGGNRPVLIEYDDNINEAKNITEKFKILFAMTSE